MTLHILVACLATIENLLIIKVILVTGDAMEGKVFKAVVLNYELNPDEIDDKKVIFFEKKGKNITFYVVGESREEVASRIEKLTQKIPIVSQEPLPEEEVKKLLSRKENTTPKTTIDEFVEAYRTETTEENRQIKDTGKPRIKIKEVIKPNTYIPTYIEFGDRITILEKDDTSLVREVVFDRKIDLLNIYKKRKGLFSTDYEYYYEIEIEGFKQIIGTLPVIHNEIKKMPFIFDTRKAETIINALISKKIKNREVNITEVPPNIGLTIIDGKYTTAYPHTKQIIATHDQEHNLISLLMSYEIDEDFSILETLAKYIETHKWRDEYLAILIGWLTVAPFFYTAPLDVRPDLVIVGKHGTMKTKTVEILLSTLYGTTLETGETARSTSRLGDILTSTTLPMGIDEVESLINTPENMSLLKSRTTKRFLNAFVRKTPDQSQIRREYLSPLILVSNTEDILMDKNYINGRVLIIDTGIVDDYVPVAPFPSNEVIELVNNNKTLGEKFIEKVIQKLAGIKGKEELSPDDFIDIITTNRKWIEAKIYEHKIKLHDPRRTLMYSLIYTGLLVFCSILEDYNHTVDRLVKYANIDTFITTVVKHEEKILEFFNKSNKKKENIMEKQNSTTEESTSKLKPLITLYEKVRSIDPSAKLHSYGTVWVRAYDAEIVLKEIIEYLSEENTDKIPTKVIMERVGDRLSKIKVYATIDFIKKNVNGIKIGR